MRQHRLVAYKIEVLDFKKRNNGHHSDTVIRTNSGVYRCTRCGWEGRGENDCPKCGSNRLYAKGRMKVGDTLPVAPRRTLVGSFLNPERAKRWGARFGTVISCSKIDTSPYYQNIEHLNLKQEPLTIEIEREDFVLNKALELERPRRRYGDRKLNVEIERSGLDKE